MKADSEKWLELMYGVRKWMGLTQDKFAAVIGMSKDAVVSWECRRNEISATSALRMSARLGLNIYDGSLAPVTLEELVAPRVKEYERDLVSRLGGRSAVAVRSSLLKGKPNDETHGDVK